MTNAQVEAMKAEIAEAGSWNGIYARPIDAFILWEINFHDEYTELEIRPGDTVLDLGAHIGGFTRWALQQGAAQVIAVEPHPESFALLMRNTTGYPVVALHGMVGTDVVYGGGNPMNVGMVKRRGFHRIDAPEYDLDLLLRNRRPDIVKMDIEGAEWGLLDRNPRLDPARELALEIHFHAVRGRQDLQRKVLGELGEVWEGYLPQPRSVPGDGTYPKYSNDSWPASMVLKKRHYGVTPA